MARAPRTPKAIENANERYRDARIKMTDILWTKASSSGYNSLRVNQWNKNTWKLTVSDYRWLLPMFHVTAPGTNCHPLDSLREADFDALVREFLYHANELRLRGVTKRDIPDYYEHLLPGNNRKYVPPMPPIFASDLIYFNRFPERGCAAQIGVDPKELLAQTKSTSSDLSKAVNFVKKATAWHFTVTPETLEAEKREVAKAAQAKEDLAFCNKLFESLHGASSEEELLLFVVKHCNWVFWQPADARFWYQTGWYWGEPGHAAYNYMGSGSEPSLGHVRQDVRVWYTAWSTFLAAVKRHPTEVRRAIEAQAIALGEQRGLLRRAKNTWYWYSPVTSDVFYFGNGERPDFDALDECREFWLEYPRFLKTPAVEPMKAYRGGSSFTVPGGAIERIAQGVAEISTGSAVKSLADSKVCIDGKNWCTQDELLRTENRILLVNRVAELEARLKLLEGAVFGKATNEPPPIDPGHDLLKNVGPWPPNTPTPVAPDVVWKETTPTRDTQREENDPTLRKLIADAVQTVVPTAGTEGPGWSETRFLVPKGNPPLIQNVAEALQEVQVATTQDMLVAHGAVQPKKVPLGINNDLNELRKRIAELEAERDKLKKQQHFDASNKGCDPREGPNHGPGGISD